MIKKILIIVFLLFSFNNFSYWADCSYDWWLTSDEIQSCLEWTKVSWTQWNNLNIEDWYFKDSIVAMVWKIAWALLLVAIWSIAYGWFMMVISTWEDEKLKKAKDIVKWSILWALWIVIASSLIAIIVNVMYSIA